MANKEYEQPVSIENNQKTISPELEFQSCEMGVFILAGGKGTRLKNSEDAELQSTPKPLVKIDFVRGRQTMLDNAITGVFVSGISGITLLTSADPEAQGCLIENHAIENYPDAVGIIRENQPLGTAGAVFNAFVRQKIFTAAVIPVDTLFPFEFLPTILEDFQRKGAGITWVVTTSPGENAQNAGRILVNPQNNLITYALEGNPNIDISTLLNGMVSSTSVGVVIANRDFYLEQYRMFRGEENKVGAIDLYRHFIPWLLSQGVQVNTYDIGQPAPDLGTLNRLNQFGRNH